jgi:hypothetical protein
LNFSHSLIFFTGKSRERSKLWATKHSLYYTPLFGLYGSAFVSICKKSKVGLSSAMPIMSPEEVLAEARKRKLRVALVVTALDLEMQAVLAHLEPLASVPGRDGAIYECGIFHDLDQDWLVVAAESGAGMHPAQGTVTIAHTHFEPEVQIFVGVGGSRKADVPIGSVVAAELVYMPYGGKYDAHGFSARPRDLPANPKLLGVARNVRRDGLWTQRIRNRGSKPVAGFLQFRTLRQLSQWKRCWRIQRMILQTS